MSRRTIGLAVIVAFSVLTPVAYASPPDATSFGGLYDNTDFDDAVAFIAGPLGAVSVCPASMASRLQLANTSVSTLAPVSSGSGSGSSVRLTFTSSAAFGQLVVVRHHAPPAMVAEASRFQRWTGER